jgi:hypothetical protein
MSLASRTPSVPYGYICGYPLASVSSEHWGYIAGVQLSTHAQALAVASAVAFWGGPGVTELPFPVCKTGHRPRDAATGEKLYGCVRHSEMRRKRMEGAGGYTRPGWASFDQWDREEQLLLTAAPAEEGCLDEPEGSLD